MSITNRLVVVLLSVLVYGCGGGAGIKKEDTMNQYIAADFTNALAQIKGMSPIKTTLSMSKKRSPLGEQLLKGLRKKGYGIRLVKAVEGENHVSCESDSFVRGGVKSWFIRLTSEICPLFVNMRLRGGEPSLRQQCQFLGG